MNKVYRSKISSFLLLIMIATTLAPVFPLLFKPQLSTSSYIVMVLSFIFCLIIVVPTFSQTYYSIEGNALRIKSGFLYNRTINIQAIRKIEETRNIVSSPALSMDRLEIIYNKFDSIIVSPQDKESFIQDLLAINPVIVEVRKKKQTVDYR